VHQLVFRFFENLGSRRDLDDQIGPVLSVAAVTLSVRPPLCPEKPLILKGQQGIDAIRALDENVASVSPIASAGSPARHKFFPPERQTAVASAAGNHLYPGTIDEHGHLPENKKDPEWGPLDELLHCLIVSIMRKPQCAQIFPDVLCPEI
jgi:hypothetical protein